MPASTLGARAVSLAHALKLENCPLQPSPLPRPGVPSCLSPPCREKWRSRCPRGRAGVICTSTSGGHLSPAPCQSVACPN